MHIYVCACVSVSNFIYFNIKKSKKNSWLFKCKYLLFSSL